MEPEQKVLAWDALHLPYSKASFEGLKALFADVEIILPDSATPTRDNQGLHNADQEAHNKVSNPPVVSTIQNNAPTAEGHQVKLVITIKKLFVQLKKQEADISFLRSLRYARWNAHTYLWEISRNEQNLQLLRHYFADLLIVLQNKNCPLRRVSSCPKRSSMYPMNLP